MRKMLCYPKLVAIIFAACVCADRVAADEPSVDDLIAALSSDDPYESAEAAVAIGELEEVPVSGIAALVAALSDRRPIERRPVLIPAPLERVADRASDILVAIGGRSVVPLSRYLADSEDQATRIVVLNTLARLGMTASAAVPAVEDELDSSEYEIRFHAVQTLAAVQHDKASLVASLRGALGDQSPHVRAAVTRELGALGSAAASAVSDIERLLDDRAVRAHGYTPDMIGTRPVRYDAAIALGKIGKASPAGLSRLRRMMRDDDDDLVKIASAFAVSMAGDDTEAMDLLVSSLGTDSSGGEVASEAADALKTLGQRAEAAAGALEAALSHPRALVRINAAEALVAVRPDEAENLLLPLLSDTSPTVRRAVATQLAELPSQSSESIAALVSALDDESPTVQRAAAVALGEMGAVAKAAVPRLQRMAAEGDWEWITEAAAAAVRKIDGSHEVDHPEPVPHKAQPN